MRLLLKQSSQRAFSPPLLFFFQSAFIQNCQRCSFYRSPKDWFYTVYTHYSHSLLKADPVTHVSPAAGPPSLDVLPTCHPSVWSLTKEKQRGQREAQRCQLRQRCFKIWQCHLWEGSADKRERGNIANNNKKKEIKGRDLWSCEARFQPFNIC